MAKCSGNGMVEEFSGELEYSGDHQGVFRVIQSTWMSSRKTSVAEDQHGGSDVVTVSLICVAVLFVGGMVVLSSACARRFVTGFPLKGVHNI